MIRLTTCSPNGDGYLDQISEIYLSMMRNAKHVDFTWTDEATGEFSSPPLPDTFVRAITTVRTASPSP